MIFENIYNDNTDLNSFNLISTIIENSDFILYRDKIDSIFYLIP